MTIPPIITNRIPLTILCLSLYLGTGCAHRGDRVEITDSGTKLPEIETILSDLAQNDTAVSTMKASGVFKITSPKLESRKKFRGRLVFERPDRLYVEGSKLAGAIVVFKMICVGPEFLMEFPGEKEQNFYELNGAEYENVEFSVSPTDIVHEMFLPEEWSKIKKRSLSIVEYNEAENLVTLELRKRWRVRRLLEVQQVNPDSPRWVIVRHERYDEHGRVLAVTELSKYTKIEEVLFPEGVDAFFPTEDTRMTFTLKNIRLNSDIAASTFDIRARAQALHLLDADPVTE